ncbi:unnamed protein product [Penicillium salamii]|nr:unnamed protein product [Penicillium salamii]
MRFSLGTLFLCALSGTVATLTPTSFKRDLKLSAEWGIHPEQLLSKTSMHAIADAQTNISIKAEFVSLPIDHDNSSVGDYLNRYWVSEEHYKPGGPVFIYDVGESTAEHVAPYLLGNTTSFLGQMMQEFNGIGIVWEHRYYGASLPYNVSNQTLPEHFQYLTNSQALADIPVFAANFTRKNVNATLTPDSTPWVMLGGSYAGMRAAFTRNEYPETIFAAYASSAPVEARVDMSVYFDQVYDGMVANGYLNCTRDIKAALEYIDEQLSTPATAALIKQKFLGKGAEVNSNGDFTAALGIIYGVFQNYGLDGGILGLGSFCEHLETDAETGNPAPAGGFAETRGNKYAAERYASWPVFRQLVNMNYQTNCNKTETSEPLVCNLGQGAVDPDTISWTWQYCTEWGYFQSNNFGPHSLLSKYQTLEYVQEGCYQTFPAALEQGYLPAQPEVDATNAATGGWTIRPSNVYWSGGQFDPWRTLSPLASGPSDPHVTLTTEVPGCGVKTSEDTLFGYVMPNAEHCFDFRPGEPGEQSRQYFKKALQEWLQCFKAFLILFVNMNLIILLALGIGLLILHWISQFISRRQQAKAWNCKPPRRGSPGLLGIPHFLRLTKAARQKTWIDYLADEHAHYGTTYQQELLSQQLILTIDPENIKTVLATKFKDFCVGSRRGQFYPLVGDGVFTLDGAGWAHARGLLRPQFSREQVTDLSMLNDHISHLFDLIPKDRSVFDIQRLLFMFTLDSATHFLFGESVGCMLPPSETSNVLEKSAVGSAKGFADALELAQYYVGERARVNDFYWSINPKEFQEANKKVHEVVDHYVRMALESKRNPDTADERYIFLRALAAETDDPKMLRDNMMNILLAGRDTTSSLLSSTFFYLSRHQNVWNRLRGEITKVFGDAETQTEITHAKLKDIPYLRYVLNEVLRLQPPAPMNFRVAAKDTSLPVGGGEDGHSPIFIHKGQYVVFSLFAMHRRPDMWGEDAKIFRPERWEENPRRGWEYLPFGGGPRICIGQQYSLTEASYTMVRLMQRFDTLENADPHPRQEPIKLSNMTMSHDLGVPIRLYSSKKAL